MPPSIKNRMARGGLVYVCVCVFVWWVVVVVMVVVLGFVTVPS